MQIRLLRDWRGYPAGRIFPACPDGAAEILIRRKIANPVSVTRKPIEAEEKGEGEGEAKDKGGRMKDEGERQKAKGKRQKAKVKP